MSVASTLLEQTERLQARLDVANEKHLERSDPKHNQHMKPIRDGLEIASGGLTFGAAPAILAKKREIADFAYRAPRDRASALLRQISTILSDGTATLDQSPAFQQNVGQIRATLATAAKLVADAEKAA